MCRGLSSRSLLRRYRASHLQLKAAARDPAADFANIEENNVEVIPKLVPAKVFYLTLQACTCTCCLERRATEP